MRGSKTYREDQLTQDGIPMRYNIKQVYETINNKLVSRNYSRFILEKPLNLATVYCRIYSTHQLYKVVGVKSCKLKL